MIIKNTKKNKEKKTFWSFFREVFRKKENKKEEEFKLGFSRFKKELIKNKQDAIFLMILTFVLYGIQATFPLIQGKILDYLVEPEDYSVGGITLELVFWFLILFAIIKTIHAFFSVYIYAYKGPRFSNKIYRSYYKKIFYKIILFPVSFFKEHALGKITHSLNMGANRLPNMVLKTVNFVAFPVLIFFNLLFVFYISWEIGLIIVIAILLLIIHTNLTIKKRKKVTKNYNNAEKEVSAFMTDSVNFSIEIKKNLKEKWESRRLNNLMSGDFLEKFIEKTNFTLWNNFVYKILFHIVSISTLFVIIYLYKIGSVTIGEVLTLIMYSVSTVVNVNAFMSQINSYVESFTVIGDTEKLLQHTPENYEEGKISKKVKGKIEFKNLNFFYDEKKITKNKDNKKVFNLSKINLKIEQGQKVAFVGESGSGKSTSIELVGGFYFPNKGELLVDDISTKDWNLNDLRSSIAYVSQDIAIFNTTIGENISYGALKKVSKKDIQKAAKLANISEYIETLPDGYKTKVGEKGLKLSGGQKQRIAIARAILRNPKILILDEPTSALDIKSETYITDSLKELMKGRTTIIIAHRISTVRDADKIFVFEEGKIIEEGNYKELEKKKGEFAKMIKLNKGLS